MIRCGNVIAFLDSKRDGNFSMESTGFFLEIDLSHDQMNKTF